MRFFLTILFIIIGIQSFSKADDITDFEIEGLSIGDKLTNIMSRQEIKQNTLPYFTDTRQYYVVGTIDNLNQYDQLELYLKTNDANFEIRAIIAGIYFDDLDA